VPELFGQEIFLDASQHQAYVLKTNLEMTLLEQAVQITEFMEVL
jgi:hypothetical protein